MADTAAAPVVAFDHVQLAFDDKVVLKDVTFALAKGRTKIILGASGSGKLIANMRSRATPFDSIRHSVVIQSAAWSPLPCTNRIGGISDVPDRA